MSTPSKNRIPHGGENLKETLKLRKLKLEAKKNHLKNLVNKKLRLEIEIKGAMRSLKKELRQNGKILREQANLDESASAKELTSALSENPESEVETLLLEISSLQTEVAVLCQPEVILSPEEEALLKSSIF